MRPWLARAHRNGHYILGWRSGSSARSLLLTSREVFDLVAGTLSARDRWPFQNALEDPSLLDDKAARKLRDFGARLLVKLWNAHDPAIRRFQTRETRPDGEAHSWLSILAVYGAFRPDFAYYEAQWPSDCYILLRKRTEGLTRQPSHFASAAVSVLGSEVERVIGGDSFVRVELRDSTLILLNHRSIVLNPDRDYLDGYSTAHAEPLA